MSLDFEKIYKAYYVEIYSFTMTIVKNPQIAEEVTQDTFYKALKTDKVFNGRSSEYTWLCAIAKNTAYDTLRKMNREGPFDEKAICIDSMSMESNVEKEEVTLKIHQVLHDMDEPYKEVFQLRIFGELSFSKIGYLLGKTENWARVTFHRSRLKIQERMEKNE